MYEQPFIPQLHRWKEILYIEESYFLTITKNTTTKQLFQTGITPTLLHHLLQLMLWKKGLFQNLSHLKKFLTTGVEIL